MFNPEVKKCQNCMVDFRIEPEDFLFYEKMKVPAPTFCSECRMMRRFAWRNERQLYKRKSDFTGKEIFSMHSADKPVKVYEHEIWHSDKWDPLEYGRNYDFSKPFFEQLINLFKEVPRPNLSVVNMANSDYCNNATNLKDCYLMFNSNYSEDCAYGNAAHHTKDSFDISHVMKCEMCYECLMCNQCYKTFFSVDCDNCQNVIFSKNCIGCSDCFGCANLRNKSYYIFNQPYSKEDYQNKIKEFNLGSRKNLLNLRELALKFWLEFPQPYYHGRHNSNISGDYIDNSKNVKDSWLISGGENVKWCQWLTLGSKDCYDYSVWGNGAEAIYETAVCGLKISDLRFCYNVWGSFDLNHSLYCMNSSHLFGCVGLKKKQYCILNKQYSKEEYENLVPKIIEQMKSLPYITKKFIEYRYGEFFPPELSPFAYNETLAQELFPLTKNESEERGYSWKDLEEKNYTVTISSDELSDNINDVDDSILNQVISCEHSGECDEQCAIAFKLIPQELKFYRKAGLPLPSLCKNCRHYRRVVYRSLPKLWRRQCNCSGQKSENEIYSNATSHFHGTDHCPNEFETSYAPERPEIVYCEQCYQAEVV